MSFPSIDSSILWTLSNGGIKKTPHFNTTKQTPAARRGIYTVSLMPYCTWDYQVSLEWMVGTESSVTDPYPLLLSLYMQTCGGAGFWYYSDPNDNTVTQSTSCMLDVTSASATPMAQVGNGTSTQFQLARLIGGSGVDVLQTLSGVSVYVSGVLTTPSSISTLGVVTFSSAPPNNATLSWTGNFSRLVMFEEDTLSDLSLVAFNTASELHSVTGIKFCSVFQ